MGPDRYVPTQVMMALLYMVFYEISIIGAKIFGKKKRLRTKPESLFVLTEGKDP